MPNKPTSVLFPLPRHVSVHRFTGYLIVFYSVVHTGAHLANLGNHSTQVLQFTLHCTCTIFTEAQMQFPFQSLIYWWTPSPSSSSTVPPPLSTGMGERQDSTPPSPRSPPSLPDLNSSPPLPSPLSPFNHNGSFLPDSIYLFPSSFQKSNIF